MEFKFSAPPRGTLKVTVTNGELTKIIENERGEATLKLAVGKMEEVTRRKLVVLARKAIRMAREHKITALALQVEDFSFPKTQLSEHELGRLLAENFGMANYEFTKYKKNPEPGIKTVYVQGASSEFQKGCTEGRIIAEEINYARDLANTPGGDMTPAILAEAAKRQLKGTSAKVEVLNLAAIKKLKMGLILGVAKGSAEEPKFIIAEYWGAGKGKGKPIVLVGKGITFDTGGINLKPTDALMGMNQDMTGGATVIASVAIAAKLKLKKNIVAIVPAVENAVSGSAYRPGDVLTAMNGTTVEVLNTDAEGRLILGDALTYAERYTPSLVVDVATLTGAAIVVVGKRASVVMANDQKLEDELRELGEKSGDYVWPLPMWKEYETDLKSAVADIANVSGGMSAKSGGGAIQGGMFLARFAQKFPRWAHLDIAPRMESIPEDNLARGATGAPIRLLVRLIEQS